MMWADETRAESSEVRVTGREETFAVFFRVHRRGVERFVRWRIGGGTGEVDDVCSDVFYVALRRFDHVADLPESAARGWLLRVADHKCLKTHRSRFRRDRAYRRIATDDDRVGYDPFDDVFMESLGDDGQLAANAREVLAGLSDSHRRVLQLDLDGPISGKQMAEALGATEVAGRLRLMRAKRAFGDAYVQRFGWTEPDSKGEGHL